MISLKKFRIALLAASTIFCLFHSNALSGNPFVEYHVLDIKGPNVLVIKKLDSGEIIENARLYGVSDISDTALEMMLVKRKISCQLQFVGINNEWHVCYIIYTDAQGAPVYKSINKALLDLGLASPDGVSFICRSENVPCIVRP